MRRFAFTPRWMAWHLLMAVAVVSCLWLGDWQWVRALDTGSLQNFAYAVQWPFFALFFAGMWWRMMRLESRKLDELAAEEAEAAAVASAAASAEEPAAGTEPAGAGTEPASAPAEASAEKPAERPAEPAAAPPAPRAAEEPEDAEDAQLAAYNRMLAALAAQDEAESARR